MLEAAGIRLDHLELPQPQPTGATAGVATAEAAAGGQAGADAAGPEGACAETVQPAAAAAPGGDGAAAELAAAPQWDWSAAESMLFPLCKYELVEQLLRSCKPPLLGRGGAIPAATLAAFRCGSHQRQPPVWRSMVCMSCRR